MCVLQHNGVSQYSLAVQQKVLELVQAWANELQPATFREVYRRLQVRLVCVETWLLCVCLSMHCCVS